jgi:hypothetical protein
MCWLLALLQSVNNLKQNGVLIIFKLRHPLCRCLSRPSRWNIQTTPPIAWHDRDLLRGQTRMHNTYVYLVCVTIVNCSILNGYINKVSSVGPSSGAAYTYTACYLSTSCIYNLNSHFLFRDKSKV